MFACQKTDLDSIIHIRSFEAIVCLCVALVMIISSWLMVMFLARRSGSIPKWARIVPLSYAGCRWQAKVVFMFGLAGAAFPLAVASPAMFLVYKCPLQQLIGDNQHLVADVGSAIAAVCLFGGIAIAILGLFLQGAVTLTSVAAQHLVEHTDLNFKRSRFDVLHFFGAQMLFKGCILAYMTTIGILSVTLIQFQDGTFLMMFCLKLVVPVSGVLAFKVFATFARHGNDVSGTGGHDINDVNNLQVQQLVVMMGGCRQWSLLVAILAFLATMGVDVLIVAPDPLAKSGMENLFGPASLAVAAVFLFFVAAAAAAFFSLHLQSCRVGHQQLEPLLGVC